MRLLKLETTNSILTSAYESAFIKSIQSGVSPEGIWLWKRPKGLYLTNMASKNYIDTNYAESVGYLPVRTEYFIGGVASAVLFGNEWGIIVCLDKNKNRITHSSELNDKFHIGLWKYLVEEEFGIKLEVIGNDLLIEGTNRKIFGCISNEYRNFVMANCMFSMENLEGIDVDSVYAKLPPAKLIEKGITKASERMTNLFKETGKHISREFIESKVIEYLTTELGIDVDVITDFDDNEKLLLEELTKKHTSSEWINYGRITAKPDFI